MSQRSLHRYYGAAVGNEAGCIKVPEVVKCELPNAGGIFNPLAGLLDGFLADIMKSFPGAGIMLDIVSDATRKVFDDGMSFIGRLFSGATDKKGSQGYTFGSLVLFDDGGWLERTAEPFLVQHKRREPDAVLRNADWKAIHKTSEQVQRLSAETIGAAMRDAVREGLEGGERSGAPEGH